MKKEKNNEVLENSVLTEEEFNELKIKSEQEAKKLKLREDMVELIKSYYKTGDKNTLGEIVLGFDGLFISLAKPYLRSVATEMGRLSFDDYLQEGRLCVINALKNKDYNPKKVAPITYFYKIVQNKFIDICNNNSSAFIFSRTAKDKIKGIQKYNDLLTEGISERVALRKAGIKKKDLTKWEQRTCINIDTQVKDNNNDYTETTVAELIPDKSVDTPCDSLIKAEFYNKIKSCLSEFEYNVLLKNNVDNLSMREIAEEYNVKEHTVRQALDFALYKLRECKELESYIGSFSKD